MQHGKISDDPASAILGALDALDQGIAVFDRNFRLLAWNAPFAERSGYPPDLIVSGAGLAAFRRFDDMAGQATQERRHTADHPGRDRAGPGGRVIRIAETSLADGGLLMTCSDVTEARRQVDRMRTQLDQRTHDLTLIEKRLKLIADEVPAGIAHIDSEMRILYTNKRFASAYERKPEDIVGLNIGDVLYPQTLEESKRFFEQARRGALVDFEMKVELPGNRFKDIRTLLRPESPSSGDVIAFYFVSINVTRWKATMLALMRSQKMDALGRMASGISHDFNNLLTIILGNLVPLSEQLDDREMVEEFLSPAISAARRGSSLTRRLLTLARREQLDAAPTDIGTAITEICGLLRSSVPSTLRINHVTRGDLPRAFVDRAQLEMALLNLAMNSRDATEGSGEIKVEAGPYELQPEQADLLRLPSGRYVRIRFSDDGCGMSADQVERIFEPFYTSKASGYGNGLGLSMVYGFVRQSNGAVWVDSEPDRGTTFSILLPSVDLEAVRDGMADIPTREADSGTAPEWGEGSILLLVEDDIEVRRTVRRKVASLGFPLMEAEDAEEALRLLRRVEGIGMILTDIDMPGAMNGLALADRVRQEFPGVGVVLMTGKAAYTGGLAGGFPFLRKPFDAEELAAVLGRVSGRVGAT
ncbi:MAG: ATP-binding protein [Paracoccaceae bacterium]